MAIINFDATQVKPDEGRTGPFPVGWYTFVAEKLDLEPTKDGNGTKINGVFRVIEGQFTGRKVFHNFNYVNASPQAQEIGRGQLSALSHATRILHVQDTAQLLNIPFKGRVKIKAAEGQYEAKNEMTAFKDVADPSAVNDVSVAGAIRQPVMPAMPQAQVAMPPPPAMPPMPAFAIPPQQAQAPVQQMGPPPQAPAMGLPVQPWEQAAPQVPNVQQAAPVMTAPPMAVPAQTQAPIAAPSQVAAPVPAEAAPQVAPQAAPGQIVPPWLQGTAQ